MPLINFEHQIEARAIFIQVGFQVELELKKQKLGKDYSGSNLT